MALSKNISTKQGVELSNAYFRIDEVAGNKENLIIRLRAYVSKEKCSSGATYINENVYYFTPSIEDTAPNFIKQGYEYLKTLPEYVDAVDC